MKVFISWSGEASKKVAKELRDWLPNVIQRVEPFMSGEDIDRGSRWFSDIGTKLEDTHFGILCMTSQNLTAPWVLFEAGALSKNLGQSKVSPFLIGVKNSDLQGPLAQFNTTKAEKADVEKLVLSINKQMGTDGLPLGQVEKSFEKWWPDLEVSLEEASRNSQKPIPKDSPHRKNQSDILEELLRLSRSISREITELKGQKRISGMIASLAKKNTPEIWSNKVKELIAAKVTRKDLELTSLEDTELGFLARRLLDDVNPTTVGQKRSSDEVLEDLLTYIGEKEKRDLVEKERLWKKVISE